MSQSSPANQPSAAVATAPGRRFAPSTGFLSGASFLEVADDSGALVWADGTRVPCPEVTLPRALRLVARGTWAELPLPRGRTAPRLAPTVDKRPRAASPERSGTVAPTLAIHRS